MDLTAFGDCADCAGPCHSWLVMVRVGLRWPVLSVVVSERKSTQTRMPRGPVPEGSLPEGCPGEVQRKMHTHRVGNTLATIARFCSPGCNPKPCHPGANKCTDWPQPAPDDASLLPEMCSTCMAQKTGSLSRGTEPSANESWSSASLPVFLPSQETGLREAHLIPGIIKKNTKLHLTLALARRVRLQPGHMSPCRQPYPCCLHKHGSSPEQR